MGFRLNIKKQKKNLIINFSIIKKSVKKKSTMKIPQHGRNRQHKKMKATQIDEAEQQINSEDIISQPQQYNGTKNGKQYREEDHRTPQQIKIAIAKKLIQKTKSNINSRKKQDTRTGRDDFFIQEPVETGHADVNEQQLGEQLKNQYLRSKNKLYTDQQSHYKNLNLVTESSYKGHTKCITGISVTPTTIYSVSKDRSIIKWDRETGKKDFITLASIKQPKQYDHQGAILCMDFHQLYQIIVTAGDDGKIKIWDVRTNQNVQTLKGHRGAVNGVRFGVGGNNLCTVSTDKTMKQWDCAQRGIIETYYGHNAEVLDIDYINQNDFISSGNDHQNIIWKTQKQTQIIYEGHDYAIDRVRSINEQKFLSASQDGSINLWSQKKKKAIYKFREAHNSWIGGLDCIKQSNIFASGDCKGIVKVWAIGQELKSFQKLQQVQAKGIITDIKINQKQVIVASSQQHRLGRWITTRVRNQIQVFKFTNQ